LMPLETHAAAGHSRDMAPAAKTGQVLALALFSFILGLYAVKFGGGGWDWGNVVGCIGAGAVCALNLFLLIRDFWKAQLP
jgi:hypothetical protein